MLNNVRMALLAAAVSLSAPATLASADGNPEGVWTMTNGKVTVQVRDCGGKLCGAIVALKEPISKIDGKPKVDRENPKPALRNRPLIGLAVLIAMKPAGDGKWNGAIYNPDDGRTYSASVELAGQDRLNVKGCVAGILCKTNKFVRVN